MAKQTSESLKTEKKPRKDTSDKNCVQPRGPIHYRDRRLFTNRPIVATSSSFSKTFTPSFERVRDLCLTLLLISFYP